MFYRIGICLLLGLNAHAQQISWVKAKGGPGTQGMAEVVVHPDGGLIAAGLYSGQYDFVPNDGSIQNSIGGSSDIFILKLDTHGVARWVVTLEGKGDETLSELVVDPQGNILLIGNFSDSCDFDTGSGVDMARSNGQTDIFLLKLDAEGNYLWSRRFGGISYDGVGGLGVDPDGHIYIGGNFSESVDFSTYGPPDIHYGAGSAFVLKLNAQGERIWFRKFGRSLFGVGGVGVECLTVTDNKLWISGYHSGDSVDFGTPFNPLWAHASGGSSVFIVRLDLLGNPEWLGEFKGNQITQIFKIKHDSNKNLLLTGIFSGMSDFDPGNNTYNLGNTIEAGYIIYLVKLDSSGQLHWAKSFGKSTTYINVSAMHDGDVLLAGGYRETMDFDPGSAVLFKTSNGLLDAFLLRLDAQGNLKSAYSIGGTSNDIAGGIGVIGETVYLSGSFQNAVDFNPDGDPYVLTAQGVDAFLVKFGSYSILSQPDLQKIYYNIYPNPTTGLVKVEGQFDFIQLMNLQGQILYRQANLNNMDVLEFTPLNDGIYLLRLSYQGKNSYQKLVIKH